MYALLKCNIGVNGYFQGLQKVFSAGLDITEFYKPNPDRLTKFWTTLQDTWLALYTTPFPTAAVINVRWLRFCCVGFNDLQYGFKLILYSDYNTRS